MEASLLKVFISFSTGGFGLVGSGDKYSDPKIGKGSQLNKCWVNMRLKIAVIRDAQERRIYD